MNCRLSPIALVVLLCLTRGEALGQVVAAGQHTKVGDPYRFDVWTTDNGLPQNSVLAILQTRDGYLWLATSDGLVRFDGVRFTVFNRSNTKGLNSNRFTALFEDRHGNLWAGTDDRGLIRYRDGVFTPYTTADGLPDYWVWAIREDQDGRLLVLTQYGIAQWQGARFGPFTPAEGLPRHPSQWEQRFAGLSFYDAAGVHHFQGVGYRTYTIKDGLSSLDILSIYEDRHGALWVDTARAGLNRLKDGVVTVYQTQGQLKNARAVCEDHSGGLWIVADDGLSRLKDGQLTSYGAAAGLTSKGVITVYVDREGVAWLGTKSDGLYRARSVAVTAYSRQDGLAGNNVYAIHEDRAGAIWIGTWDGGLSRYKDGAFSHYTTKDGLSSDLINALYEDREGALWVGTHDQGVNRLEKGHFTTFNKLDGLTDNTILAIYQDRAGNLWFGTPSGLNRYKDGSFTVYSTADGLVHRKVQAIHEDRAGNLWLGTLGGLSRLRDGKFTSYTEQDGLSSNHVRSIYEDSDGTLWVGTYDGGLNRLKDGRITAYTVREGLFNNGVFQILEDNRGNLWMSCNQGIYRVSKKELNDFAAGRTRSIISVAYGKSDGMLNSECNGGRQPAGVKARDGRLWFPTQAGVAVVDPEAASMSTQPPPVVIEQFILDKEPVALEREVRILPRKENLEIHYTGLSLIRPEHIRFKYKLEGLDHDWVEAGHRRTAYYSHVPPGHYTFTVIAANSDGVWNIEGPRLPIVVVPPFWHTWWFRSLALVGLAGVVVLAHRRRVAQLKRAHAAQEAFSRQLIESQERERQRIAAELHDSLSQSMVIIKNRAVLSLSAPDDHQRAFEQLDEIAGAASHAIDEVKEIAYALRPYHLDRLGLTKAIEAMLKKVSDANGVSFSADIDPIDGLFPPEAEINLYRILQEGVNNVVKHAQATEAKVTIKKSAHGVDLTIQDNGRGFTPGVPASAEAGRGGFGLISIAERARLLGGQPVIQSVPGAGTTISVRLGF